MQTKKIGQRQKEKYRVESEGVCFVKIRSSDACLQGGSNQQSSWLTAGTGIIHLHFESSRQSTDFLQVLKQRRVLEHAVICLR